MVALGIVSAFAGNVLANDTASNEKWVGGFTEYYSADKEKSGFPNYYDDGIGFSAEFGFRFKPQWAARIELSHLSIDASPLGQDTSGNRIGLDALYFLPEDVFYVFGGIKHFTIEDRFSVINYGMGKHWNINKNLKVITEMAAYIDFDNGHQDIGVKLGLAYTFGASAAPVMPKDSDNDGVNDVLDMCGNTVAGAQVDAKGCAVDEDGDGVLNSLDVCPNTPVGTRVEATGCFWDKDLDGVANNIDACPATPTSDKVDDEGCSIFVEDEVKMELSVRFAKNSSYVNVYDYSKFQAFVDFMTRYPKVVATIEGHSSAPGEAQYNQWISQKRAESAKAILVEQFGLSSARLKAVGYGETQLLDTRNTPEANTVNRRIVAKVTATENIKLTK